MLAACILSLIGGILFSTTALESVSVASHSSQQSPLSAWESPKYHLLYQQWVKGIPKPVGVACQGGVNRLVSV